MRGVMTACVVMALSACGGHGMFSIGDRDSTPEELRSAISRQAQPVEAGGPLVIMAVAGVRPQVVAYDLAAKKEKWRRDGVVTSHFVVTDGVVAHAGDGEIVARSRDDGHVLWRNHVATTVLGLAAEGERIYLVTKGGDTHGIQAVSTRSGATVWSKETSSRLGAPAARGGQVFLPLLDQWLLVIDGATGKRMARVRGVDHQISFVRANEEGVFFGSNAGVYALDDQAAPARAASSSFAVAKLPEAFSSSQYGLNAYDETQTHFSAYDRNRRVLWSGLSPGAEPGFSGGLVATHVYRFLFGLDAASGELKWAYSHPRVDLVASEHLGAVIGIVSASGQIAAIEASSGTLRFLEKIDGKIAGATFAAPGWVPSDVVKQIQTPNTTGALTAIARDRDQRFARIKKLALEVLAKRSGDDALIDLISVITSGDTRPDIYQSAVDALASRRDPASLPHLLKALGTRYDHVKGTEPRAVGVLARAVGTIEREKLSPDQRKRATAALVAHLEDPATSGSDLAEIVEALRRIGDGSERPVFRRMLLIHRADQRSVSGSAAFEGMCKALASGSAPDRAAVRYVAEDARTRPILVEKARAALSSSAASQ